MLTAYFNPLKSGSVFSAEEQAFIQDIRAQYGVTVIETLYEPGKRQTRLTLWVDTDGDTPFIRQLRETLRTSNGSELTHASYAPPIRAFARDVMRLYAQHFGIEDIAHTATVPPDDPCPGCCVYVRDFKQTVNDRAHAEGVKSIRKKLKKQFGMPPQYVIAVYGPTIVACVQESERYQQMKAQETAIRDLCYQAIKPFDRYGIITEADIGLDIVLWDKLDRDTRNAYAREIVANPDK